MKSRARSYRFSMIELNCRAAVSMSPPHGNRFASMTAATSMKMIPVASSGSKNPLDSPMATQFLYQLISRYPASETDFARLGGLRRRVPGTSTGFLQRGVEVGVCRGVHVADAAPCISSPMSQVQPASCAVEMVYEGIGESGRS